VCKEIKKLEQIGNILTEARDVIVELRKERDEARKHNEDTEKLNKEYKHLLEVLYKRLEEETREKRKK